MRLKTEKPRVCLWNWCCSGAGVFPLCPSSSSTFQMFGPLDVQMYLLPSAYLSFGWWEGMWLRHCRLLLCLYSERERRKKQERETDLSSILFSCLFVLDTRLLNTSAYKMAPTLVPPEYQARAGSAMTFTFQASIAMALILGFVIRYTFF